MIYQLFLAFASIIDYSSQLVKKIPIELNRFAVARCPAD